MMAEGYTEKQSRNGRDEVEIENDNCKRWDWMRFMPLLKVAGIVPRY